MLLYLGKIKIHFLQIFSRYRIKCKQIAFKCINFNSSTPVTVYPKCIYVLTEYLKYLSIQRIDYFFDKMKRAGCYEIAFGTTIWLQK